MINKVHEKDAKWRSIAFNICKDRDLADDLVQEMYLKILPLQKKVSDGYVTTTIKNLFLNTIRDTKYSVDLKEIEVQERYEPNDFDNKFIQASKELKFYELELLELSAEHSVRDLESRYKIHYSTIARIINRAKEKIWLNVEDQKSKAED